MSIIKEEYNETTYTITLNRPEFGNAMNKQLLSAFLQALKNAHEKNTPVVVIRGAGSAFTVGGDLTEMMTSPPDDKVELLHESIKFIRTMGAITIAVLEGAVAGAGVGLSLACDLSVATKGAYMNMAFRRIGLTPDGGASLFLPRIIGVKRFNDFYLFSRNVAMEEARELGLINFLWEKDELEDKLEKMIHDLAALPVEPIAYYKDLLNRSSFASLAAHLDREKVCLSELTGKPGFIERLKNFFKKK
jgi:2-(1,2-epoxy-1,2-dihydrophenyl)acetyl-CoA isomerase